MSAFPCPVCGQVPSADARFCRRCGARLPPPSPAAPHPPKPDEKG
ncbi:zinc ribbon domain-containing protein [Conexibacter woesei]